MGSHKQSKGEFHIEDLTWRERDILNLLAERLSNREIAERLFLAESSVKDYVGKIIKKLYAKNRREVVERAKELGLLGGDNDVHVSVRKLNLPSSATPFIGRKSELDEIRQQLGKTRLLTLAGPGGMGKTRLSLKTAEEVIHEFKDGCFFVSLAPIHSVEHIVQAVAEAVYFPIPTNEDPKLQLIRYLQKKNLLLVMDNFEHLMDGAGIVGEILEHTAGVKILVTSRERLNLKSETVFSIAGMIETNKDAVSLFLQGASKMQPDFDPSSNELIQIDNICRFVGGMPLAIELAASWLHVLSVSEIRDELQKGLDLLESELRDAPERHRSIRAVFDQSWSLLDRTEKKVFMCLSIFKGGFTRDAAGQVAGASLRQIAGLVNKSILMHDPNTNRFEIHELLRQYAQEKLESTPGAVDSTQEVYAAYYAAFMQEKWQQFRGPDQVVALAEIEADIENVRVAWRYYLAQKNALQLLKLIYGLWIIYWVRGWFHGGIELFADCVDALSQEKYGSDAQAVKAVTMAHKGYFLSLVGLANEGYTLAKESIAALEKLDHPVELAFAYQSLTLPAYYLDLNEEEKDAAQKFLEIAEKIDDTWLRAYALWLVNLAEIRVKNYEKAKNFAEASLNLSNEINDAVGSALCFSTLGGNAIFEKNYPTAKEYFKRCLQISRQLNFDWLASNAIKYLGQIALQTGDIPEAQRYLTQSLKIAFDLGVERDIANHLYNFASMRVAQNKPEEGVELLSLLLGQPASRQTRAGGGSIRDSANSLLTELEGKLSRDEFTAAVKRGELSKLDDVVIALLNSEMY